MSSPTFFIEDELVENIAELSFQSIQQIRKPQFTRGDIGVDLRKIIHWEQVGLLEPSNSNKGWRNYSLVDFIWVKIIVQLREYGIGLKVIATIKNVLLNKSNNKWLQELLKEPQSDKYESLISKLPIDIKNISSEEISNFYRSLKGFNLLLFCIYTTIHSRHECHLIINIDKGVLFQVWNQKGLARKINDIISTTNSKPSIIISLSHIIREFISNEKIQIQQLIELDFMNRSEQEVINAIREKKYHEISITMNDGKIKYINLTRHEDPVKIENKIFGILRKGEYQNIEIKTAGTKVLSAKRTRKIKMEE